MRASGSRLGNGRGSKFGFGGGYGYALAVVLASCARVAVGASGDRGFQWKFDGNMVQTNLNACQSYGIIVQPYPLNATTMGTPPYYMMAFVPGGIPTTSFIGTDPANLTWTVNQPVGSQLLLSIADAEGLGGGIPPALFGVTPGSTDSCISPRPSVNITIVTNVTNPVETCQPVGFRVYGGQMPYNLSLAAVNSPVVTNVTMGPTDDVFTFINRADPNGEFLAAISDATGTWGTITNMITTVGSADVECVGLISTAGNSSFVDQNPPPPSKSKTPTIVLAVVIPIIFILLALGVGWWYYKKKREERLREPEPAFLPEAWSAPVSASTMSDGGSMVPVTLGSSEKQRYFAVPQIHFTGSRQGGGSSSGSQVGVVGMNNSSPRSLSSYDASSSSASPAGGAGASGSGSGNNGNPGFGYGRSNSMAKGRRTHAHGRGAGAGAGGSAELMEPIIGANGVRLPPGLPAGWEVEPQILIQHRDGGAVPVPVQTGPTVQEIPPPYIDRGDEGASADAGASAGAGSAVPSSSTLYPSPISPRVSSPTSPGRHPLPPIPQSPSNPRTPSRTSPIPSPPPPPLPSISEQAQPQPQPQPQASRYSAPLPNLPGPLPPPPAPTGLPANPAPLRLQQQQRQQHREGHSPQPSLQSQNQNLS